MIGLYTLEVQSSETEVGWQTQPVRQAHLDGKGGVWSVHPGCVSTEYAWLTEKLARANEIDFAEVQPSDRRILSGECMR